MQTLVARGCGFDVHQATVVCDRNADRHGPEYAPWWLASPEVVAFPKAMFT